MKRFLSLILVLAMVLGITSCSMDDPTSQKSQSSGAATGGNSASTSSEADHTFETAYWANLKPEDVVSWKAPKNYKKVGMLVPDGTNEFYVGIAQSAEKALKEAGYELVWTGIGSNPEAAITAVETWTSQGIDALIVMATDTSCEKACLKAMEQGVLLVLGSATFESYHVWCCQDYYDIGYQTAKMAADWLKENYGDNATYVTFGGNAAEFQTQKTKGVEEGMKEFYPNGTCAGNLISADITSDMETLLTQNPDINAVVTWHATFSLQALNAAKAANRAVPGKFFVFGSQMTAQSLLEIKNPESCYIADTWMGDQGKQYANVVTTLLSGGEIKHWDSAPPYVVNADNAETYYEDYYKWLEGK